MFKDRLVQLRTGKGLSQYELAKSLGLSRGQISNYELGSRQPDYETLIIIANFFDVTIDYLLGRSDISAPTPEINTISALYKKFIRLIKGQRGQVFPEALPLILMEMARLYAISKGVPLSVIGNQLSQETELSDAEKAQLANEIDAILQEESNSANELAKEIENLSEKERQAMEAMLDVLKNRNNDAAAQES